MGECLKNKKKVHDLLRYGFLGVLIVMGVSGCGKGTMKEPVTVTICVVTNIGTHILYLVYDMGTHFFRFFYCF